MCYFCQFSMVPLVKPAYWVGATVCYVVGVYGACPFRLECDDTDCVLAMNMVIAFYAATFPGIVEDLPEVKASEQDVMTGAREYVQLVMPKHNRLLISPDPRSTTSCCPINVPSSTTCSTLLDHRSKSSRPPSPWVLLSPSVTALTLNFSTRTKS